MSNTHTCNICGKEYTPTGPHQTICRDTECIRARNRQAKRRAANNRKKPQRTVTCQGCGKQFQSNRANAKHCSSKCNRAVQNRRRNGIDHLYIDGRPRDKNCAECGEVFSPSKTYVKYCTPECAAEADRKIRRERYQRRAAAKRGLGLVEPVEDVEESITRAYQADSALAFFMARRRRRAGQSQGRRVAA